MNVLPLIRDWLDEFGVQDKRVRRTCALDLRPSRKVLQEWLKNQGVTELELATDSMIAAGIGREEEQGSTVYCRVTY